jgi:hypothetical protein
MYREMFERMCSVPVFMLSGLLTQALLMNLSALGANHGLIMIGHILQKVGEHFAALRTENLSRIFSHNVLPL